MQRRQLLPLAAAYVAYIVLCNLNLNINPVGFYQITKIAGLCACCAADCCCRALGGSRGSRMSSCQRACAATPLAMLPPGHMPRITPPVPTPAHACPLQWRPRCWRSTTCTMARRRRLGSQPRCWLCAWVWAWPPSQTPKSRATWRGLQQVRAQLLCCAACCPAAVGGALRKPPPRCCCYGGLLALLDAHCYPGSAPALGSRLVAMGPMTPLL